MNSKSTEPSRIRYGVVSAGWVAQSRFMPGVPKTGNSRISAIVTGDADKAAELGERYGAKIHDYSEYEDLLGSGEIDAVYISPPNREHVDYATRALEAGIHVLLEKPMAISVSECRRINRAARETGAKLMLAYRLHFEPATLDTLRKAHDGTIGEPRLFSSVFCQNVDLENHRARSGFWAGPVADMAPYPINAARMLFRAEPIEVHAVGTHTPGRNFNFHDTVSVTLRFPDERLAQFTVCYSAQSLDEYRIVGTDGNIEMSPAYMFGALKQRVTQDSTSQDREFPAVDQFAGELEYFSDCLLHDREPEPDGEEGLLDVRILEAIERALDTGLPQVLDEYVREHYPSADQARSLPASSPPELINAAAPEG